MSIVLVGSTSGSITLQEPAIAGTTTLNLPATSGTVALTSQIPASGKVLQVVSTTITSQQSFGAGTSDVSGLSTTITPSSSSNKILVIVNLSFSTTSNADACYSILRSSSAIPSGVTSSVLNSGGTTPYQNSMFSLGQSYLDNPATTSATTYKVQVTTNTGTLVVNRRSLDTNFTGQSTITLMEIAP